MQARASLGPRKISLTKRDPSSWREIEFKDHAGRPARSGWWIDPAAYLNEDPDEGERQPKFSVQIYSTIPIETSLATIARFFNTSNNRPWDLELRYDLYAPVADLPACVDHQRLEIAYRLAEDSDTHPLYPIPRYLAGMAKGKGCDGFLVVITSETYKLQGGRVRHGEEYDPGNPLWVLFRRTAHTHKINRSLLKDPKSEWIVKDDSDPRRFYRELLEMYFHRINRVIDMPMFFNELTGKSATGEDEEGLTFDFSLDNDEPVEQGVGTTSRRKLVDLSTEDNNLSVSPTRPPGSSTQGVLIANYAGDDIPTLCYLVYLNFGKQSDMKLSTVGLGFTSEVLRQLAIDTKVHFEFYPTPSDTNPDGHSRIQRILGDTRAQLLARPGFTIGGLQFDGSRAFPISRTAFTARFRHQKYYSTFSVILNSSDFVQKPDVLFALNDGGDDIIAGESVSKDEMEVWRSTGIDAVAQRLRYENGLNFKDEPSLDGL